MSRLRLYLLGPPRLELDGEPVHLPRRKAMALLAYLAVTGRAHSRDSLATLLWPENDQQSARAELSRTLSLLNRILGPESLAADRATVALGPELDLWLDTAAFRERLAAGPVAPGSGRDVEAVELYRDDFLAGFTLRDSAQFDEWQFFQTQALKDELAAALEHLAQVHDQRGEVDQAISYARRWLSLDPLHEPAHRALMRLYDRAGQRTAALRQYRECVRVLEKELDVAPSAQTTALYEQVRARRRQIVPEPTVAPPADPQIPAFLRQDAEPPEASAPVFVARESELAQLQTCLDRALAGRGRLVFLTGDAGRGKTALLRAYARQAMEAHADLLVVTGNCNAYSGLGDPYLPFREVLAALTGDVQARWAAGEMTREHARRLWEALPLAVDALLDRGSALIDVLIPGAPILARARAAAAGAAPDGAGADWVRRLQAAVEGDKPAPGDGAQSQLYEQTTDLLRALSAQRPLLLLLDDLQWADDASVSLLAHLGARLAGSRILIVGAYRPEEVALGRRGERHPLDKALAEFKRRYGDVWIDLAQADEAEGERFVEALLETEPNRLGEDFHRALFEHAGGHPLFTVELLRALQERGELVRDERGRWIEGPGLDWDTLPARVEGVIEERIARLDDELREILSVASVEGEAFTAQVVAAVEQVGERQILRQLARELEKRHRLVREGERQHVGAVRLARYQFAHALFQQYLYNDLSEGERALLHGEVAEVLEALYERDTGPIVAQLAHHFARAGRADKAAEYLTQVGDRARLAYAHQAAIDAYRLAVAFMKEQERYGQAARTLFKLGLTCHHAYRFAEARQAYDEGFDLWQQAARTAPAAALSPAPHSLRVFGQHWAEPATLDPALSVDMSSSTAICQLFCRLMALSPEHNVVPDVARRWETLEGGRTYVFYLRDDVHWSDGVPLTARDFEFAWKRILDPATESPRAEDFYHIQGARAYHQGQEIDPQRVGVRAVDDRTLVVELEDPTGDLLYFATGDPTAAVPRHAIAAHGRAWAEPERLVTSGPFRLAAWERGRALVLERSPTYHGRFAGNVERVEAFLGAEQYATALLLYEQDQLDILGLGPVPLSELDRVRQQHASEYVSQPVRAVFFAGLNVSHPALSDRRVRRALVMAVDRERMADLVYKGHHFPATGGLLPPCTAAHSPGIALPYDPARARRLLAEAGYPDGRAFPPLTALTFSHGIHLRPDEYLHAQWRENLGIDVSCQAVEIREYLDRLGPGAPTAKPPIWYGAMNMGIGRDDQVPESLEGWFTEGWRNEAYTRLEAACRQSVDPDERLRLCREADSIIVEEAPTIILAYVRLAYLVKPWVTRFPLSASSRTWWKDTVIEPH
jgi:ABC-type oligopeptide transport system substrate-binding subunit/DNA-binding SARP family transcriptional activator